MPSRLVICTLIAIAGISQPCLAQKLNVVSTHPPLSPVDAVAVLRSSHSLSDMANRPIIDPDGPHVYVFPDDRFDEAPPFVPGADALSPDGIPLVPYGGMYGGFPYGAFGGFPYAAFGGSARFRGRDRARPFSQFPDAFSPFATSAFTFPDSFFAFPNAFSPFPRALSTFPHAVTTNPRQAPRSMTPGARIATPHPPTAAPRSGAHAASGGVGGPRR